MGEEFIVELTDSTLPFVGHDSRLAASGLKGRQQGNDAVIGMSMALAVAAVPVFEFLCQCLLLSRVQIRRRPPDEPGVAVSQCGADFLPCPDRQMMGLIDMGQGSRQFIQCIEDGAVHIKNDCFILFHIYRRNGAKPPLDKFDPYYTIFYFFLLFSGKTGS